MIFDFILTMNPLLAIILISAVITAITTFLYKYLTDQKLMRGLKQEIKGYQAEMKKLRDSPQKMMKVQKKAMDANMKYMMHSFKPTLFTLIPIIIIFAWLNAHLAYYPIIENQDFTTSVVFQNDELSGDVEIILPAGGINIVSGDNPQEFSGGTAAWTLNAQKGDYSISYRYNDNEYSRNLVVTDDIYDRVDIKSAATTSDVPELKNSGIKSLNIGYEKIRPLQEFPLLRDIPWIGGFGWLGVYIIFSIAFSMGLRKALDVY